MSNKKYYVVWRGRVPGVYETWAECEVQTNLFKGASFKSFISKEEAETAFKNGKEKKIVPIDQKITRSIAVDAAWSTTTKVVEYQGVYTDTKEIIFKQGPYKGGTNNVGEFLALVHALAHCKKNSITLPIYSDSKTALAWVRDKKINSAIEETEDNKELIQMLDRAQKWLKTNTYTNQVLKWETASWGETPADYGRK
jgi:ribonuclease HI